MINNSEYSNNYLKDILISKLKEGISFSNIMSYLRDLGFSGELIGSSYDEVCKDLVLENENLKLKVKSYVKVLEVIRIMENFSKTMPKIDLCYCLSYNEFQEKYLFKNKPVIIKNLIKDWPALKKWDPNYFEKNFAKEEVEVMDGRDSNINFEVERDKHRVKMKFIDFISRIKKENSNNTYLTASNEFFSKKKFHYLLDDIIPVPGFIEGYVNNDFKLWFGSGGTITPLHHDNINLLLIQIFGKKSIKLIPSSQVHLIYSSKEGYSSVNLKNYDLEAYPLLKKTLIYEVLLQPGDILFIPILWWHFVESINTSISLSYLNLKPNILINSKGYSILE